MTSDKPETNQIMDQANWSSLRFIRVSDDFIAFTYAAGVSVFLEKAHDGKLFNYPWLTICVVVSIFFFAQDWLSRFGGFRRIEGVMPAAFYLKAILDVAVVICLCLIILDAISQMDSYSVSPTPVSATSFYCKVSAFALTSWVWNMVVIFTVVAADPQISRRNIISFLVTGHVSDELLALFPKVHNRLKYMRLWLAEYIRDIEISSGQLQDEKRLFRHWSREFRSFLRFIWKLSVIGPFYLVPFTLTCWIGLHLLVLNLFLGLTILISTIRWGGAPLIPSSWLSYWVWIIMGSITIVWISSLFRTVYFSGEKKKQCYETISYGFFWVFLLGLYSTFNVQRLVVILAVQQIVANFFIFSFLLVPTKQTQTALRTASVEVDLEAETS